MSRIIVFTSDEIASKEENIDIDDCFESILLLKLLNEIELGIFDTQLDNIGNNGNCFGDSKHNSIDNNNDNNDEINNDGELLYHLINFRLQHLNHIFDIYNRISYLCAHHYPRPGQLLAKIVGMCLELPQEERKELMEKEGILYDRVIESIDVLLAYHTEGETSIDNDGVTDESKVDTMRDKQVIMMNDAYDYYCNYYAHIFGYANHDYGYYYDGCNPNQWEYYPQNQFVSDHHFSKDDKMENMIVAGEVDSEIEQIVDVVDINPRQLSYYSDNKDQQDNQDYHDANVVIPLQQQ